MLTFSNVQNRKKKNVKFNITLSVELMCASMPVRLCKVILKSVKMQHSKIVNMTVVQKATTELTAALVVFFRYIFIFSLVTEK